ncbi:adhesion g protein-coupled receptor l3 [Plakobranchus ocellatus]|uniref:Adhesion g protein-coupled receptor l3 n=1 Tax=Plakobranchus ocellatus TaxID=259542 RepID=A0AAV3YAP1_9GAST|nr:adhesion g protein-coupled receptor l3 [Plakobranchus ocellatus]
MYSNGEQVLASLLSHSSVYSNGAGWVCVEVNAGGARVKEVVACPDGFENLHRQCFRFVDEKKTWAEADAFCKSLNSDLATLEALQERDALKEVIEENYDDKTKWWIGYRRRDNRDRTFVWEWIPDGSVVQVEMLPWRESKFRKRPRRVYCGGLIYEKSPPRTVKPDQTLLLSNDRCKKKRYFICELHPPKTRPQETTFLTTTGSDINIVTTQTTTPILVEAEDPTDARANEKDRVAIEDQRDIPEMGLASNEHEGSETLRGVAGRARNDRITILKPKKTDKSDKPDKPGKADKPSKPNKPDKPEVQPSEVDNSGMEESETATTSQPVTETTETMENDTDIELNVDNSTNLHENVTENDDDDDDKEESFSDVDDIIDNSKTHVWPSKSKTTPHAINMTAVDNGTTAIFTTTITTATTATTATTTTSTTTPPRQRKTKKKSKSEEDWALEFLPYRGCYTPGVRNSLQQMVKSARNFYPESRNSCPSVKLRKLAWPRTEPGQVAKVQCKRGKGFATFRCDKESVCWKGEPDTTGCASSKLQSLLERVERRGKVTGPKPDNKTDPVPETVAPPTVKESVELTSQLVQVTAEEENTTIDDIIVTSHVLTALTNITLDDDSVDQKKDVEEIVGNVVKAGSNLVSEKKRDMWQEMTEEDKVRSASTLLVAMETATVSMAEKIEEPTVVVQKNEDVELELRVLDIETLEREKKDELVYDSDQSENTFSIPVKTLKKLSKGRLAKAVFMTHYSMSDILGGRERKRGKENSGNGKADGREKSHGTSSVDKNTRQEDQENKQAETAYEGPQIASYILSASIGVEGHVTELPEPITFTMRHVVEMEDRFIPLCSFWNVSDGVYQGFWSQAGCRVLRTNKSHTKCECDHLTNFAVLMDVHGVEMTEVHQSILQIVTIIGCCISCAALLASFLTFTCFTSLQGERNTIHKNLSLCLLLAEVLFVCGIDRAEHQVACSVIAGFLHFLFLAAFAWMFLEGVHIIFMLVQVFDASRSRLPYYYIAGYGIPTVIVGVSLLFFHEGYGTDKFCWLTTERYFIWSFAGPVALFLLINSIFLAYALSTVCRHADYVFNTKEKTTVGGFRSWVQGAMALEVLLGLTWVFGYFLLNDNSTPIAYIFTVLNSLQGLFIFIFHCLLNKKTQKEYSQVMQGIKLTRSPSMKNTNFTNTRRTSSSHANTSNNQHNRRFNTNTATNPGVDKMELNHNEDHVRLFVSNDSPNDLVAL